jgi:hypothetical protein
MEIKNTEQKHSDDDEPEEKKRGRGWLSNAIPFNDRALKCEHKSDLIPSGAFRCAITGLSGTGKTQFLLSLLPLVNDCLKWVIVCSRVKENAIHEAIGEWCQKHDKYFFKATDDEQGQKAIEIAVNAIAETRAGSKGGFGEKPRPPKECMGICIFDDYSTLRGRVNAGNDNYTDTTVQTFNFLRNYAVASVIISQYSWSIPQRCMTSVNMIVCFRSSSKTSLIGIDLIVGLFFEDRPYKFMDCYREFLMPKDCKHNFIVCNLERGEFHVVDFRNEKSGVQLDLLDSMDRAHQAKPQPALAAEPASTSGAGLAGGKAPSAQEQKKSIPGEIKAGNDSPELHIQRLMQMMKSGHSGEEETLAMINRIAQKNGIGRDALNYLWRSTK